MYKGVKTLKHLLLVPCIIFYNYQYLMSLAFICQDTISKLSTIFHLLVLQSNMDYLFQMCCYVCRRMIVLYLVGNNLEVNTLVCFPR